MIKAQATTMMTAVAAGNGSSVQPLCAAGMDQTRAHFIMDLVALAAGVPAAQIRSETRNNARAARARQIAMYLAYVSFQWPLARIGAAFGRDRTAAGYACRLVEDLRDDRGFDSRLDRLETCLKNAPDPFDVKLLGTNLMEMVA
ncbi:Chromosomal replication initiator protein DnaA [Asticcacaulis sp. MM231]|uniref:helix-turn-helix domain-containing protein n=1 Tax=Asticcacaulis sp. MM231 TaxID=3157666 RepID=UPI0032D56CC9